MPELRESAQWVVLATVVVLTPALLVVAGPVPTSSADVVVEARPSAPTKPGVAPIPPAPVAPRTGASAVWTGAELVVWGGSYGEHARPADPAEPTIAWQNAGDGAAYNPGRGTWRLLASSPLAGRSAHVAVWTGEEMIVWGGWSFDGDGQPTVREDGAAYNPLTDRWRPIAPAPIPGRGSAAAVWTGRELLVVGGAGNDPGFREDAAAYDPAADRWRPVPVPPIGDTGFHNPTLHRLTGDVVLVADEDAPKWAEERGVKTAARWDPAMNTWTPLPEPGLAAGPYGAAVAGDALVVVVTRADTVPTDPRPPRDLARAAVLHPGQGWRPIAPPPGDPGLAWTFVAAGERVIALPDLLAPDGARPAVFDPHTGWTAIDVPTHDWRRWGSAVWTGGRLLLWGGTAGGEERADGVALAPYASPAARALCRTGGRPLGNASLQRMRIPRSTPWR